MNRKELPKLKGKRLQLDPKATSGAMKELQGSWVVLGATEHEVTLRYIEGGLVPDVTLNPDHIHHYTTNSDGRSDGFLTLLVRVVLDEKGYRLQPIHPILDRSRSALPSQALPSPGPGLRTRSASGLTQEEMEILVAASGDGEMCVIPSEQLGRWVRAGSRDFVEASDRAFAATVSCGPEAAPRTRTCKL